MKKEHLFKPGQSGNPAGRKPGQTPGAKIRAAIEKRKDDILQAVIDAAIAGDMQACKMLLDRITPPLKPVAAQIALPVPDGAGLADQGAVVVTAALTGQIPPDIGSQLITALAAQSKIIEMQEMAERLERIEHQLEQRK
jgi:mevalonate kinase